MTRRTCAFTKADLRRAIKGIQGAGVEVSRIEIQPDGKIVVVTERDCLSDKPNELDGWMAKRARSS